MVDDFKNCVLETKRLVLRELTPDDFNSLCNILQDDETMYAYEGAFDDKMVCDWLNKQIARYEKYGFGLWAVILKSTGEFIGQCGVTVQDWKCKQVFEVGYLFQKEFWHKGYATESAIACKEYAFKKLGADMVCSIIRDNNIPSQNVAKRNGMTCSDDIMIKHYRGVDMPHLLFRIYKSR